MRVMAVLFVALSVLGFGGAHAAASKRVALVIGNAAYRNVTPLANPINDAAAIADMLTKAAFDVVGLRDDLSNAEMRRALRDFSDSSRDADIAVIYYAGHGIEVDGVNYLIPVDASIERDTDAYDEAIALERILQAVEPARQLRLVILDACRDNPFSRKMKRTLASRALGRGLAGVEPNRPNTLVAFAAKGGSTALDGDSKNSPFTSALLKHLTTPGIEVRRAFGLVHDDVMAVTGNKQEPFVYGSLGGSDVSLVPAPSLAHGNAAADARRDYELAEKVGTREGWDSFIAAYPTGFYSDLANSQRNKLAAQVTGGAAVAQTGATQKVAALPAPDVTTRQSASPAPVDIPRVLQSELQRVGCRVGDINGVWSMASQRALSNFNRHAGTTLDAKVASLDALEAVRSKSGRICPLACERGYRVVGEQCVAIACQPGFSRGDDDVCRRIGRRGAVKPAVRHDERSKRETARRSSQGGSGGSGQIICNDHGCRPVSKGCRASDARGPFQSEVCN